MEEQEKMTPQQSLTLISTVISQTKENFKTHSFVFLLWGIVLATASFLRFFLQTQTRFEYSFLPFPILCVAALVITWIKYRVKTSESYLYFFLKKMWSILGIGFITIVFVSVFQKIEPFTYTLILAAIGTLVSGFIMHFRPLILGGICFFVASICCVLVPDDYKVLIHGFAIIIGYLVPGYLLKISNEAENGRKF